MNWKTTLLSGAPVELNGVTLVLVVEVSRAKLSLTVAKQTVQFSYPSSDVAVSVAEQTARLVGGL